MFNSIIVKRLGTTKESFMITNRIIKAIHPDVNYKILVQDLMPLPEFKIDRIGLKEITKPKYVDLKTKWLDDKSIETKDANILGKFGKIIVPNEISIPVNLASYENVRYYGASLYSLFDIVKFQAKEKLSLTEMIIGSDYVNNYIMNKDYGGGQYLEYHDNPHFHSPMSPDCKGCLILGKMNNELTKIRLSAFIIPYYKAIYTPGYVIHNDANLVGKWLVVYSKTDNYSTVLMRDVNDNCSKINFTLK